jgi:hypothetical protein
MNRGVLIIIWIILALIIAVGLGSLNMPKFWRRTKHASQCQGTVTEVTVVYHNTVCYKYTVNNRVYTGQTQTGFPNPEPGNLRSGDALVVFFDPDTPSISVLEAPDTLLKNEIISWGLAAVVFPSFIVFGIKRGEASFEIGNGLTTELATRLPNPFSQLAPLQRVLEK